MAGARLLHRELGEVGGGYMELGGVGGGYMELGGVGGGYMELGGVGGGGGGGLQGAAVCA